MVVRRAEPGDLPRLMEIYRIAQDYMIRSGNPTQWARVYPEEELVRRDIEQGISYVVCEEGRPCGVFALMAGEDPTYRYIEDGAWLNDEPYLTIHRVASDGTVHGVFTCVANHCKTLAPNLRIDTHHKNLTMQHQIERNGFVRCGTIYVLDGSPRIAYQWHDGL